MKVENHARRIVGDRPGVYVRARLEGGRHLANCGVFHGGRLDRYQAEEIAQEALRSGPGTVLDLELTSEADENDLKTVRAVFSWLADHGVRVSVDREESEVGGV